MLKKKSIHFNMLPMHALGWLRFGGNQIKFLLEASGSSCCIWLCVDEMLPYKDFFFVASKREWLGEKDVVRLLSLGQKGV
jgi:hypothetical protein